MHNNISYLEYVHYDWFTGVNSSDGLGDFTVETWLDNGLGEMFTATWLDGERETKWTDEYRCVKWRIEPLTVSLEVIVNSTKIDDGFIGEVIVGIYLPNLPHLLVTLIKITFFSLIVIISLIKVP